MVDLCAYASLDNDQEWKAAIMNFSSINPAMSINHTDFRPMQLNFFILSIETKKPEVTKDIILTPIATLGRGKTTLALALTHLFGWGHIQNDNISGKGRSPRFVKAVMDQLKEHPVVFADHNNAHKHERKQLIGDVKALSPETRIICLNFRHDEESIDEIRQVTQD
ncbi:hypothetical protein ACHAQJ_006692 [Trichoderma viride]